MSNPKEFYKIAGAAIKKARRKISISQSEVGKALGVAKNTVSRYESGDVTISLHKAAKICAVLKIDLSDLVKDTK